ncbi:MAG: hypothetical protein ACREXK_02165 [Gammaproteobacteria bacterium]
MNGKRVVSGDDVQERVLSSIILISLGLFLAAGCVRVGEETLTGKGEHPFAGPGEGQLVRDPDEDAVSEEPFAPIPVADEGFDGIIERADGATRCAVIVGDDTLGVGPKDAQDFEAALRRFPEWSRPNGLYQTILANATKQGVQDAILALHARGCVQLVFFYSGHGSNRRGDREPRDEGQAGTNRDEYLSLRNDQSTPEGAIGDDRRVFDDDLAEMLRAWQVANRSSRPVPGAGDRQFVYV